MASRLDSGSSIQTDVYNITVDNERTILEKDGLVTSPEDFVANAEKNIKAAGESANEFSTYATFCEYGVGALCGRGGGVSCYALLRSIGCTAATDQICN